MKAEPKIVLTRLALIPFLIQFFEGLLSESLKLVKNGCVLDIDGCLYMLFGANKDVSLCCGVGDIVKGKTVTILVDDEMVSIFLLEDLAKLAVLIMSFHAIISLYSID